MNHLKPVDEQALAQCVAEARGSLTPLEIVGGGTRRGIGNTVQAGATLETQALHGVTLYEPSELVVRARAGTPVAEVEKILAAEGQRFTFEPPDYSAIASGNGVPTVGGLAAANLSGPRRIMGGGIRDSMIGIRAVSGEGKVIKSGGRVMKDVTGLDLVKLVAGSWGTLAVLSEVTFKVLPVPETEASISFTGLTLEQSVAAMSAALGSPWEVNGAARLPDGTTVMRIEGFADSVRYRIGALAGALKSFGEPQTLNADDSSTRWQQVRDLHLLKHDDDRALWRVSVAPSRTPAIVTAVQDAMDCEIQLDWGGGLFWVGVAGTNAVEAGQLLRSTIAGQGHVTLIRGPEHARTIVGPFQPMSPGVARMTELVLATFDPDRILNPGRMYREG